ncbi:MAG: ATP-binding protein [Oscillospiraceae bacterium]|nr:ATP-binding protein [Oscillospiraceae bacterium]
MFYLILQMITILASFALIIISVYLIRTTDKEFLVLMLGASLVNSVGTLLIMMSDDIGEAIMAFKIQSMGACFVGLLVAMFLNRFFKTRLSGWAGALIFCMSLTIYILVLMVEQTDWLIRDFSLINANGYTVIQTDTGLFYPIVPVTMASSLILIYGIVVKALREKVLKGLGSMITACVAATFPIIVKTMFIFDLFEAYDPTSLSVLICCIVLIYIVHKYNLFDVVSIARNSVIETMGDSLIVVDRNMKLLDANTSARKRFSKMIAPADEKEDEASVRFFAELFRNMENSEFSRDGRCYEKRSSEIYDKKRRVIGFSALIFDVTTQKEQIEELTKMRLRAERASSAKSDFLANMSHEIRTPMNAIAGFAELCMQEKDYKYAQGIKTASSNMLNIINDILDISKIEAGKLELLPSNYDTMGMINEVISIVKVALSKKHTVQFISEIDPNLPRKLHGDEVRIRQVLINLLNNAVKFTKEGYINFSVSDVGRNGNLISIKFKIKDTGIGITKEDIGKLFVNFQQVDTKKNREIEGTGLGLSITKSLVELMKGNITVESVYGEGSCFTVMIEQKIADSKRISSVASTSADMGVRMTIFAPDAQVLIVDDNKVNLKVTQQLLQMYGIKADIADSGRLAVRMVNSGYYDLVFMDHMMPEMDGVETTKLIRSQGDAYCRQLPIIALTANAVGGAKDMFLEHGLNDFLSKPIEIRLLEAILEKWLPSQLYTYKEQDENTASGEMDRLNVQKLFDLVQPEEEEVKASLHPSGVNIDGIDVAAGLQYYGGKVEAYLEVLKIFYETGEEIKRSIEKNSSNRKNLKNYTTEVHGLKSAALTVGATALSEQAKALEFAGKAEDYKTIQDNTPLLLASYGELLAGIGEFFNAGKSPDVEITEAQIKTAIAKEELKEKIIVALELFDSLEFKTAGDVLRYVQDYSYYDETVLTTIGNCISDIDNFDYDKAEARLKAAFKRIESND